MRSILRFSRDKRFFTRFDFDQFTHVAYKLARMMNRVRPAATVEVITCEDPDTYNYSTVTFDSPEVDAALEERKTYCLDAFTKEAWARCLDVQLTIREAGDPNSFMVTLSCDRHADGSRLLFYGQGVSSEMQAIIRQAFARADFFEAIGDGFPKPSDFNWSFAKTLAS